MTRNEAIRTMISGITVALLLCAVASPLVAQDDTRTQEEVAKACKEKVKQVHARMQRLAAEEHGSMMTQIRDTMHAEFLPKMKAGKYREAEEVADRVLAVLIYAKNSPVTPSSQTYPSKSMSSAFSCGQRVH